MKRRAWEPWEDDCMRRWYGNEPIDDIALVLGRRRGAIYQRARVLGLTEPRPVATDEQIFAALRRRHPDGWSDREIADELGDQLGCEVNRHRVGILRRQLGLANNRDSARQRERTARRTREQLDRQGLATLADLRRQKFDEFKASLGWPEALTVRAAQACELFWRHGPMTRLQLCKLMRVDPRKRTSPTSNAKGGTVLAELQRHGLLMRLAKQVPAGRDARGHVRKVDLYLLNPGVAPDERKRNPETCGRTERLEPDAA